MGCGGSRLAGGGKPAGVFSTRLRPLFLLHMRHPSPKLLLDERDYEDESCSASQKFGTPLSEEVNVVFGQYEEKHGNKELEIEDGFPKNLTGSRDESEFEDALADEYKDEDEDENENEDKRRMIGHKDEDGACPGSPTFRYFCKDDEGKIYAMSSDDDDTVSSKENNNDENNKVKRGRKRNSFKKVLPKGASVKKLFSVKSYYNRSSSARRNHSGLLVEKAVA